MVKTYFIPWRPKGLEGPCPFPEEILYLPAHLRFSNISLVPADLLFLCLQQSIYDNSEETEDCRYQGTYTCIWVCISSSVLCIPCVLVTPIISHSFNKIFCNFHSWHFLFARNWLVEVLLWCDVLYNWCDAITRLYAVCAKNRLDVLEHGAIWTFFCKRENVTYFAAYKEDSAMYLRYNGANYCNLLCVINLVNSHPCLYLLFLLSTFYDRTTGPTKRGYTKSLKPGCQHNSRMIFDPFWVFLGEWVWQTCIRLERGLCV